MLLAWVFGPAMRMRSYAVHADYAHMREYADENLIHIIHMYSREGLITRSLWSKLLPLAFLFLLVYHLRKHLSLSILEWFWVICNVYCLQWGSVWRNLRKWILGNNFWLEWHTDLRSMPLSYIFINALFRGNHFAMFIACSQIAK